MNLLISQDDPVFTLRILYLMSSGDVNEIMTVDFVGWN